MVDYAEKVASVFKLMDMSDLRKVRDLLNEEIAKRMI